MVVSVGASVAAMNVALLHDQKARIEARDQAAFDEAAAKREAVGMRDPYHRRRLKRSKAAAVRELVEAGQGQIVLAHIHPRWLRELVEAELNAGYTVSDGDIARWKAQGPALAELAQQYRKDAPTARARAQERLRAAVKTHGLERVKAAFEANGYSRLPNVPDAELAGFVLAVEKALG